MSSFVWDPVFKTHSCRAGNASLGFKMGFEGSLFCIISHTLSYRSSVWFAVWSVWRIRGQYFNWKSLQCCFCILFSTKCNAASTKEDAKMIWSKSNWPVYCHRLAMFVSTPQNKSPFQLSECIAHWPTETKVSSDCSIAAPATIVPSRLSGHLRCSWACEDTISW